MLDKVDIVNKDIITSDSIQFKGAMLDYDSNCSTGNNDYLLPKLMTSLIISWVAAILTTLEVEVSRALTTELSRRALL